jgi:putative two-component system response regulator
MIARPQVLVVDDGDGERAALVRLLDRRGFTVLQAADGAAALAVARRDRPDAILMDVRMPRLDGVTACRTLKGSPESALTPVILVSGADDEASRVRGLEAGADAFFAKPYSAQELLARIESSIRAKQLTDRLEPADEVMFALALSVEARAEGLDGHCERLSVWAAALGDRLGLDAVDVDALRRGGIVHDVGKVAVPDRVLLKRGALDQADWSVMQLHPVTGERIMRPLRTFERVLPIVRHHHERMDGSGYPDGLRGDAIPVTARVLQVVDIFDALTSERPYKRALTAGEALDTLDAEVRRGWRDGTIVRALRGLVESDGLPAVPGAAEAVQVPDLRPRLRASAA